MMSVSATIHPSSFKIHPFQKGDPMRKIAALLGAWIVAVTSAHLWLNVNWDVLMNDRLPEAKRKLNVAYIPVT